MTKFKQLRKKIKESFENGRAYEIIGDLSITGGFIGVGYPYATQMPPVPTLILNTIGGSGIAVGYKFLNIADKKREKYIVKEVKKLLTPEKKEVRIETLKTLATDYVGKLKEEFFEEITAEFKKPYIKKSELDINFKAYLCLYQMQQTKSTGDVRYSHKKMSSPDKKIADAVIRYCARDQRLRENCKSLLAELGLDPPKPVSRRYQKKLIKRFLPPQLQIPSPIRNELLEYYPDNSQELMGFTVYMADFNKYYKQKK